MSFLSYKDIELRKTQIFPCISEYCQEKLKPDHYELRLGDEYFVSSEPMPKRLTGENDLLEIPSGDFALLITYETIKIPADLLAFISIKMAYKKLGLVNISGFHVNPGYEGKIIFSVQNVGPNDIFLRYQDAIFMIFFTKLGLNKDTEISEEEAEKSRKGATHQNIKVLPVDLITSVKGTTPSLARLDKRINTLETTIKILAGIIVTIFTGILWVLLRK